MEAVGNEDPVIVFFPEVIVEEIPGVMLRIGLNDTSLTRALLRGNYPLAESIIEETTDIDFLNDGALNATPLNIVLTGPGGQYQQPRNLKLARLLLLKGANPNMRIPNQDLESASESPLELILRYYLKLLEVFTVTSTGLIKENYSTALETELMDCIGINGELGGLNPRRVVEHTRDLLHLCLEQGGDPNLPTTEAARTIFHLALIAPIPDSNLIQKLVDLGANINHADVHNTTPLMDLMLLADEDRVLQEIRRMEDHGQIPVLDNQNCTLQSALFRASFQGKLKTAMKLLELGANPALCARTQQEGDVGSYLVNRSVYTGTPAMLAPLLGNSPCWWRHNKPPVKSSSRCKSHVAGESVRRLHRGGKAADSPRFRIEAADKLIRESVAPLVDHGGVVTDSVAQSLFHLVRCLTQHRHIADSKKVDPKSAISLMFGQKTAGLRQLAVRAILKQVLFNTKNSDRVVEMLKQNCIKHGYTPFLLSVTPSMASMHDNGSIVHEFMLEPDSELELSLESTLQRGEEEREDIDRLLTQMNSHLERPLPMTNLERNLHFVEEEQSALPDESSVQHDLRTDLHQPSQSNSERAEDSRLNPTESGNNSSSPETSANFAEPAVSNTSFPGSSFQGEVSGNTELVSSCGYRLPSLCLNTSELIEQYEALLANTNRLYNHYFKSDSTDSNLETVSGDMEIENPVVSTADVATEDNNRQLIKSFSDLRGLSQEDVNKGKRLLLVQMLNNMDPKHLTSADHELIALHPNVEDQLIELSRKLQLIGLSTSIDSQARPEVLQDSNAAVAKKPGVDEAQSKNFDGSLLDGNQAASGADKNLEEGANFLLETTKHLGSKFAHVSLNDVTNGAVSGNSSWENRMQLDENWSLGSVKNLEPTTTGSLMNSASRSLQSINHQPINHSVEIVKSLEVKVTVSMEEEDGSNSRLRSKDHDEPSENATVRLQSISSAALTDDEDSEFVCEPDLGDTGVFMRGPHQLSRLLSSASDCSVEVSPPSSPVRDDSDTESDCSLQRAGTQPRTLSLKHTCCRPYPGDLNDDGPVISYLSAQVLDALTLELGIPTSLRPCFSLEAARLQIALVLAANHSIHCDRNCEGDDSDVENDDEEDDLDDNFDIADSDTDSEQFRVPMRYASSTRPSSSSTSPSSLSNMSSIGVSIRSIFGSVPSNVDEGESSDLVTETDGERRSEVDFVCGRVQDESEDSSSWDSVTWLTSQSTAPVTWLSDRLDQRSDSSWLDSRADRSVEDDSSSWLEDRAETNIEEFSWLQQRYLASHSWLDEADTSLRRFLSESPPPPEWYHSTSSDSDEA